MKQLTYNELKKAHAASVEINKVLQKRLDEISTITHVGDGLRVHGSYDAIREIREMREAAEQSKRRQDALEECQTNHMKLYQALRELCETKIMHEAGGDTPDYRVRKLKAWGFAFACFPQHYQGNGLTAVRQ